MKSIWRCSALVLGLCLVTSMVGAGIITTQVVQEDPVFVNGTNADLDGAHNAFFIPLTEAASGWLGASGGSGGRTFSVGQQRDTASLGSKSPSADGSVLFRVHYSTFNSQMMEDGSAYLTLTFRDLDFLPQTVGSSKLTETLGLTYVPSDESPIPSEPNLFLDTSNYMTYRVGTDSRTNNVLATYRIPLKDLGLTSQNFNEGTNTSFDIVVTLTSHLEKFRSGASNFRNTGEYMTQQLEYTPYVMPEPMTMLALLLGVPALLRRNRR